MDQPETRPYVGQRSGRLQPHGEEMTKRIRSLWVGLVAVATTMAVFGIPAIVAGLTFNALD
jgi:hypothetical protein